MADFLQRNGIVVLFVFPVIAVFFVLVEEKLGSDRDMRKGRFNLRTLLFSIVLIAAVYALVFLPMFCQNNCLASEQFKVAAQRTSILRSKIAIRNPPCV